MELKSIEWKENRVKFIDQTKLPNELEYIETDDYKVIAEAIKQLRVRGAPLIGITAAFGIAVAIKNFKSDDKIEFFKFYNQVRDEIACTRPTARNLFYAIEKIDSIIEKYKDSGIDKIVEEVEREALSIYEEDRQICDKIGENGQELIKDGTTVLTHCNTGFLVTGGIGTALAVIYKAIENNKRVKVYADETRPLLQGARLTTWELKQKNIDVTLICDSVAASLMQKGKIDLVIVGADRIAKNGDTANKIGTYNLAVLCKEHKVPFYISAPYTTFDKSIETGKDIIIEERGSDEVTSFGGRRTAPENVKVYNPAFDVTPADLISGIITEEKIFKPPFIN